jgi:hypothetical protein
VVSDEEPESVGTLGQVQPAGTGVDPPNRSIMNAYERRSLDE